MDNVFKINWPDDTNSLCEIGLYVGRIILFWSFGKTVYEDFFLNNNLSLMSVVSLVEVKKEVHFTCIYLD